MYGDIDHLCNLIVAAHAAEKHGYFNTAKALERLISTERNRLGGIYPLDQGSRTHNTLTIGVACQQQV